MEDDSHGFDDDPAIKEENAEIKHKGGESKRLKSSGWTDEKHMHYLSSVEQSFVDELNNKYCEELVDGLHRETKLSHLSADSELFPGQFKMFSKGELKVVNFGSCSGKENKPNEGQKNENMLFSNPWIQRWMSSKDHRLRNQDSGLSEMSGQNFLDEEIEGVVESNMIFSKKRSRSPNGSDDD